MLQRLYYEKAPSNESIVTKWPLPKKVFIVPYRDREYHKHFFLKYMNYILEEEEKEKGGNETSNQSVILFAHQQDQRPFNRGAMKNLGFLVAAKDLWPNNYKEITFIFHDVDTLPYKKGLIDYDTTKGIIKHYYGYEYTLGGIFAIKGADFERINGFPSLWAWGFEDNAVQQRALNANKIDGGPPLLIDRSCFFKIDDMRILHLFEGPTRQVSKKERDRAEMSSEYVHLDGLSTISSYRYNLVEICQEESAAAPKPFYKAFMLNFVEFDTGNPPPKNDSFVTHHLLSGNQIQFGAPAPASNTASLERHRPAFHHGRMLWKR